jgi:hypothetical protein
MIKINGDIEHRAVSRLQQGPTIPVSNFYRLPDEQTPQRFGLFNNASSQDVGHPLGTTSIQHRQLIALNNHIYIVQTQAIHSRKQVFNRPNMLSIKTQSRGKLCIDYMSSFGWYGDIAADKDHTGVWLCGLEKRPHWTTTMQSNPCHVDFICQGALVSQRADAFGKPPMD